MPDDATILGTTTSGYDLAAPVSLSEHDRRRHLYVIGKTGTGKSTLLLSLLLADLHRGRGLALLDPHGDLARSVVAAMPRQRIPDCIYLDPADLVGDAFGLSRDALRAALAACGVETRTYFVPIHVQPVHRAAYRGESYPVAEDLCRRGLYLPSGPALSDADVDFVAGAIEKARPAPVPALG